MNSKQLLARLPPLKSIMCIVRSKEGMLGTALSDPYLGFATPLASITSIVEINLLIEEHRPGGLLFGASTKYAASRVLRDEIILLHGWNGLLTCSIEQQLTINEAISRKETE